MRVGIDLDGVCYSFVQAMADYVNSICRSNLTGTPTCWEFYETDWGMDADEFVLWVNEGIDVRVVFAEGEPLPGTLEALHALRDAGHTLHIVTDRQGGTCAKANTEQWLQKYHVPYDSLTWAADKTVVRTDVFIDDRPVHVDALRKAGTAAYLMDCGRSDQAGHPYLIKDWAEFVAIVASMSEGEPRIITSTFQGEVPTSSTVTLTLVDGSELRVVDPVTGGAKGQKLAQMGALDPLALLEVAKVAGMGAQKYERYNFLKGFAWSLAYDAGQRHENLFWSGEDLDPESGLPHVAHAAWQMMCLLSFMLRQIGTDDRPPRP